MKGELLLQLKQIIDERINIAKNAMDAAQESANNEGKSSAGDKYETGRAMGQIEVGMYAKQLANAQNEKMLLDKIDLSLVSKSVGLGTLVETNKAFYFISISLGELKNVRKKIYAISQSSPIGAILMGKKVGEGFVFNGQKQELLSLM
jgi:transcription elongation GreA/GreB family factor